MDRREWVRSPLVGLLVGLAFLVPCGSAFAGFQLARSISTANPCLVLSLPFRDGASGPAGSGIVVSGYGLPAAGSPTAGQVPRFIFARWLFKGEGVAVANQAIWSGKALRGGWTRRPLRVRTRGSLHRSIAFSLPGRTLATRTAGWSRSRGRRSSRLRAGASRARAGGDSGGGVSSSADRHGLGRYDGRIRRGGAS